MPSTFLEVIKSIPGLTHYYPLDEVSQARDVVGSAHGSVHGTVRFANGRATFDGKSWIEVPSSKDFSVTGTGEFTQVHFLHVTDWAHGASNGEYTHYLGKGRSNAHEWTTRYYMDGGSGEASTRKRRTSFYSYNAAGGLGAGSFVQDVTASATERMLAGQITTKGTGTYPGWTKQWQNGVQKDQDQLSGYSIRPTYTTAPLGIGSRGDGSGFLIGTLRRVAFFNRLLTSTEMQALWAARNLPNGEEEAAPLPPVVIPPEPTVPPPTGGVDPLRAKQVRIGATTYDITGANIRRTSNALVIYTEAFGATTKTNIYGTEVGVTNGTVAFARTGAGDSPIPKGGYILSGHGLAAGWLTTYAEAGDTITLIA